MYYPYWNLISPNGFKINIVIVFFTQRIVFLQNLQEQQITKCIFLPLAYKYYNGNIYKYVSRFAYKIFPIIFLYSFDFLPTDIPTLLILIMNTLNIAVKMVRKRQM